MHRLLDQLTPRRLLKLERGAVEFAAVDFFILRRDIAPCADSQLHAVAGTQAGGAGPFLRTHAPGADEGLRGIRTVEIHEVRPCALR